MGVTTHLLELGLAQSRKLDVGCDTRPLSFGVVCECGGCGGWDMCGEWAGCPDGPEWDEWAWCAWPAEWPEWCGGGGWPACAECDACVCEVCAVCCDSAGDPELMLPSSLRSGGIVVTGVARGLGIAPGPLTEPDTVLVRRRFGRRTPRGRSKSQLVRR